MDIKSQPSDSSENQRKERFAKMGLKINKYVLFIPLIPSLFLATSEVIAVRAAGLQRTLPATMLMTGILAYPLVYVFSMVLSKKYYEDKRYDRSLVVGLSPIAVLLIAAIGQIMMPIR